MNRLISGAIVALLAAVAPLHQAQAFKFLHTSDGTPLRWAVTSIPYYINTDGFSDFEADQVDEATQKCLQTWSNLGLGFKFDYMGTSTVKKAEDDEINVIFFEQDPNKWEEMFKGQEKAFAMTRNWAVSSGAIQGFDMVFNDWNYQFTNTDDPTQMSIDFCNTLTHEAGHVLGLDHSPESDATMYYTSGEGEVAKRDLSTDDIAGVHDLYADGFVTPSADGVFSCTYQPAGSGSRGALVFVLGLALPAALLRKRRGTR